MNFYEDQLKNLTKIAHHDRKKLIYFYEHNKTSDNPPPASFPHYDHGFPQYCIVYKCYGYTDEDFRKMRLLVDYLCVPAWTGIMVDIIYIFVRM